MLVISPYWYKAKFAKKYNYASRETYVCISRSKGKKYEKYLICTEQPQNDVSRKLGF